MGFIAKWLHKKWKQRKQKQGGRKVWRKKAAALVGHVRQEAKDQGATQKQAATLGKFRLAIEDGSAKDRDIATFVKKVANKG